ncbi:hypothetical protein ACFV1X_37765 [Streptomyces coelicoflavus]|uniref:hypothetical protein n=1 Tax=Streptomyces coelicoflavus TaxID=285562 RepID=UPI00369582C5
MDTLHVLNDGVTHEMAVELTVFDSDQARLSECAVQWLTEGVRQFAGTDVLQEASPYRVSAKGYSDVPALRPRGEAKRWAYATAAPNDSFDVLYNPYVPDALPWLMRSIDDRAESITVVSGLFADKGEIGNSDVSAAVGFEEENPSYGKLILTLSEAALHDPERAATVERSILRSVQWACNRYNVVFGHFSYRHACGETELEKFLRGDASDPAANTPKWRFRLRGYSWLMVVPGDIADALGGVYGLSASPAFHSVSLLPNGALLLQATPTFREYCGTAVRDVHRVVRDVLIEGEFRKGTQLPPGVPPPYMVVFPD